MERSSASECGLRFHRKRQNPLRRTRPHDMAAYHRGPAAFTKDERAALRAAFATPTTPFADLPPSPRAMATFPASPPLTYRAKDSVSPGLYGACNTWSGRPISKWCRWGCWSEDGWELTVTRILRNEPC